MGVKNSCCSTEVIDLTTQVEPISGNMTPPYYPTTDVIIVEEPISPEFWLGQTVEAEYTGKFAFDASFDRIYTIEEVDELSASISRNIGSDLDIK